MLNTVSSEWGETSAWSWCCRHSGSSMKVWEGSWDQRGRIHSLLTECMLSYLSHFWFITVGSEDSYICVWWSPLRSWHTISERPVEAVSWGRQVLGLARVGCRASPQSCMPSVYDVMCLWAALSVSNVQNDSVDDTVISLIMRAMFCNVPVSVSRY